MKKVVFIILFTTFAYISFSQFFLSTKTIKNTPLFDNYRKEQFLERDNWAKNQLEKMTLEEKIAQLMMIRIYSNKDSIYEKNIIEEIQEYQPGGVCFFQGSPIREINLTNRIQEVSNIPLLVAIDGEWGPAMRLDSCSIFPYQLTLGALNNVNDTLIYQMGVEVAKQCKTLGIHINFAPCADVNNNSQNPVINFRSFGENREKVAKKSILYMQGMQDNGVSACAKHFPGHGDTKTDSHFALPIIPKSFAEIDSLEFYPFKKMIEAKVDMIMISHLNVPALDSSANSIASLSKEIIGNILINKLNFHGIVITDAMDMQGLRNSYPKGSEAEIVALLAGVDILLLPNQLENVIPAIKEAVIQGVITEKSIDEKCLKVLKLKQQKELTKFRKIPTSNVYNNLNSNKSQQIIKDIEEKTLTLLKNEQNNLPLLPSDSTRTAFLFVGDLSTNSFYQTLAKERKVAYFQLKSDFTQKEEDSLMNKLENYDKVVLFVISKHQSTLKKYGMSDATLGFIDRFAKCKNTILALYANPYLLEQFKNLADIPSIFVGYKPTENALLSGIAALYNEIPFAGKLPVTSAQFLAGTGTQLAVLSENIAIFPSPFSSLSAKTTENIDEMIKEAISTEIFPGCQILAIHNGQTIYHHNFGRLKYEHSSKRVDSETLYDLASITKSLATSLAIMKLYDEKKLLLTDKIGDYLTYLQGTDKENLTLVELLTHTSGLPAYIPFYKSLSENGNWDERYLNNEKNELFSIKVAKNVYLNHTYIDEIHQILASCSLGKKKYLYSDIGFFFLKELVEKITQLPFEQYITEQFYEPLGLERTLFNPRSKYSKSDIAPTENDTLFRKQVLQGYVHDQTAALLGGVCGNAGLFSTANELAIILQMIMNGGSYNNIQFISPETVKLFTSTYVINGCKRRALGFDSPNFATLSQILPEKVGKNTFGHQGFTGTVFWCDPENSMIYIFLSNRVYPNVEPNKLSMSKIRLIVQQMIYDDLF